MLNTFGHNELNAQYCAIGHNELNAQYCAIMHLCISFSLFEQLFTICCACVVHKVKNCAQMHNSTKSLHNAIESCVVLSIVHVCCS